MIVTARRHLYLAGFMGTGKTATGLHVADALRRPFYDLDTVVEQITGRRIPEVFAIDGEAAFRQRECRALRSIVGASSSVIALGGGAPTIGAIRALVRESGRAVLLTADLPSMWSRLRGDESRPLLEGEDGDRPASLSEFTARVQPILKAREDAYRAIADWTLDTSALTPVEAGRRTAEWWLAQAD
ncbi:MAG: shikimate kinase [Candidatus Zixiibacteriota bacterium]